MELRAGNSWPLMGFDCDVPEKLLGSTLARAKADYIEREGKYERAAGEWREASSTHLDWMRLKRVALSSCAWAICAAVMSGRRLSLASTASFCPCAAARFNQA